jgi:hypothetical protein
MILLCSSRLGTASSERLLSGLRFTPKQRQLREVQSEGKVLIGLSFFGCIDNLDVPSPESHETSITLSAPYGAEGVSHFTFLNCLQKSKWLG